MRRTLLIIFILITSYGFTQKTKQVLFIGNSYTNVNNLPEIVKNLATADGNILIKDASFPGGHFLSQHTQNPQTLQKIASNNWDMVVIQEQSQNPSFPWAQVQTNVFPYAKILIDSAKQSNECVIPIFYNTWGRRDGDSQWDSISTFEGMNARLHTAYSFMANDNQGLLSPVGIGFQHIKQDTISPIPFTDLYVSDGSHPSIFGSYLAACIFNNIIFSQTSYGNTFIPNGVTPNQAKYLQEVADHVVYMVDSVRIDYRPLSNNLFGITLDGDKITLSPYIEEGTFEFWDFGDGDTSHVLHTTHTYTETGIYHVRMITSNACYTDTISEDVIIGTSGMLEQPKLEQKTFKVYPNPSHNGKVFIDHKEHRYSVYSILGDRIYHGESSSLELSKGMYFFRQENESVKVLVF